MIEKMERITLYGLAGDSRRIIDALMKCGCVQLEDPEQTSDYEEIRDWVSRGTAETYDQEQILNRMNQAMGILAPFGKKKGLLTPRRTVSFEQITGSQVRERALQLCSQVGIGKIVGSYLVPEYRVLPFGVENNPVQVKKKRCFFLHIHHH